MALRTAMRSCPSSSTIAISTKASPRLLSFDDARTLFHEFGHALHGLLSQVRFPRLSGTNVARDFVELPLRSFTNIGWKSRKC